MNFLSNRCTGVADGGGWTQCLQSGVSVWSCSHVQLCDPVDCSPPGSSVHGDSPGKSTGVGCHALLQGVFPTQGLNPDLPHCRQILYRLSHQGSPRIPEWVAYPFSRGFSPPRDRSRWILYQLRYLRSPVWRLPAFKSSSSEQLSAT